MLRDNSKLGEYTCLFCSHLLYQLCALFFGGEHFTIRFYNLLQ